MDLSQLHFRLLFSPYFGLFITPTHLFVRVSPTGSLRYSKADEACTIIHTLFPLFVRFCHTRQKKPAGSSENTLYPGGLFTVIQNYRLRRQVWRLNRASMGKISRRPNSISIVRITLEKALYAAKELVGPTSARPGPMLLKQANTAEMFASTENPSSETSRKLPSVKTQ